MRQPQPAKAERLRTPDAVAGTTNKPSSPTLNPSHIKIVQGTGTFAPVPNPRARFSAHGANEDWPGAIAFGWAHTNADLLGVIDADLQHPPELLPTLISKVADGCDIAIASRYVQTHSVDGWNPLRAAISRVSLLASKPVQIPALAVKDPMSGYLFYGGNASRAWIFNPPGSSSYSRFWPDDTLAP